jgi:hypothetical protein
MSIKFEDPLGWLPKFAKTKIRQPKVAKNWAKIFATDLAR